MLEPQAGLFPKHYGTQFHMCVVPYKSAPKKPDSFGGRGGGIVPFKGDQFYLVHLFILLRVSILCQSNMLHTIYNRKPVLFCTSRTFLAFLVRLMKPKAPRGLVD